MIDDHERERLSVKRVTNVDAHIGARIRLRRATLFISQSDLAAAIGVSFQQMQKYEIGENRISASRLYHISIMLDAPVQWFFEDAPQVQSPTQTDLGTLRDTIELAKMFLQIRNADARNKLLNDAIKLVANDRNDVAGLKTRKAEKAQHR